MSIFDEEPRRNANRHEIGQDLSLLSTDELNARIDVLKGEIGRLEAELRSKDQTKSAAEALFRRS